MNLKYNSTMQEEWKKYRDMIYPEGVSAVQDRECHQAFFAGALAILNIMTEATAALSDDEAGEIVAQRSQEIMATCELISKRTKERSN